MCSRSHRRRSTRHQLQSRLDTLGSGTFRRPDDRAGQLGASAADVYRATIEAHLERPLASGRVDGARPESSGRWPATNAWATPALGADWERGRPGRCPLTGTRREPPR